MSSSKSDSPAAAFSYAQAAKGQAAPAASAKPASAPASGISTPALAQSETVSSNIDGTTSPLGNTAEEQGDRTTVAPKSHEDATAPRTNDAASDSVESSTNGDKTAKSDVSGQSTQATEAEIDTDSKEASEPKAVKPVYTEAKPPTVNIWAQRAAEQKAKVVSPAVGVDGDARRKSEPASAKDHKRDVSVKTTVPKPRRDEVESGKKPAAKRESDLPLPSSETAWPKPTDAHTDERKSSIDKDDKVNSAGAKVHGKTEWTKMAYTPTAVFETRIEGRGAGRMGKGVGKNGQPASARGPPPSASFANKGAEVNGRANGRSPATKSERDAVSPHGKASPSLNAAANGQDEPTDGQANGVLSSETNGSATQSEQSSGDSTRKNKTRAVSEGHQAEAKANGDAASEINGTTDDSKARKPGTPERRADENGRDGHGFREGKRGGRKGGNRGGFNNSGFTAPNPFANGFQEFQSNNFAGHNAPQFFQPRGNGSNRGYRNQGPRSQSIPIDPYARQMGAYGYSMLPPMHTYNPEFAYGGPYSAGPFGFQGQGDLISQAGFQIEYYFSLDNLVKDMFLRKQMDSQGWVFLETLAQFNRLKIITTDQDILRQACLNSSVVEVRIGDDGKDRVRKGQGWQQFVLAKEERDPSVQNDGPTKLRRPSPVRTQGFEPHTMAPQSADPNFARHSFHIGDAQSAPFFPGAMDPRSGDFIPAFEETRGRQNGDAGKPSINGHSEDAQGASEGLTNGVSHAGGEQLTNGTATSEN